MRKSILLLLAFTFFYISNAQTRAKKLKDLSKDKQLVLKNTNKWAVGAGVSNFIMHGDLRSIGTGELGNFWNFGIYAHVDRMFNPILGLQFKAKYTEIAGGAQYFSDVYDILYVDGKKLENNIFFEGKAYGAELNMILSFSNLYIRTSEKWNLAGYFGIGYHQYDSKLYEQLPDGNKNLLIDFGVNPDRINDDKASSIFFTAQLGIKRKITKRIDLELKTGMYFSHEDHLDATISNKQVWENFFVNELGVIVKLGKKKNYSIWGRDGADGKDGDNFKIVDTDGDGVMDLLDIEPDTPKGVLVYGNGRAIDSDKDGLPDYKDNCPLEPGPISNQGCPTLKDTDGDGLYDHEDLCPMQKGPKENKGCPKAVEQPHTQIVEKIGLLSANVYFDTNRYTIRKNSLETLNKIAKLMLEVPDVKFIIEGHTDNRDKRKYNQYLSQRRAANVKRYLVKQGVGLTQLESVGYGETRPKYSNETPEGRQLNRRVEIKPKETNVIESPIGPDGSKTEVIQLEDEFVNKEDTTAATVTTSTTTSNKFHLVVKGDTLYSISKKYNISIGKLKEMNKIKGNSIVIGKQLIIKE